MEAPGRSRLLAARLLLGLAVILIGVAQWLSWERVIVDPQIQREYLTTGSRIVVRSTLSQIPHMWWIEDKSSSDHPIRGWMGMTIRFSRILTTLDTPTPPSEIRSYQGADVVLVIRSYLDRQPLFPLISWPMLTVVVWLLAIPGMLIMPFVAGPLSRAQPLLWIVRFFSFSMLVWLIRHLILIYTSYPSLPYKAIGSGYWLSLVALLVEITGLFLIPKPRQASPPLGVAAFEPP
ncbi:MAG: hypothetical protein QM755_02070 [Luteolibacter sp.]